MKLEEKLIDIGLIKKEEEKADVDMSIIEKLVAEADFVICFLNTNSACFHTEHCYGEYYIEICFSLETYKITLSVKKNFDDILKKEYKKEDEFFKVLAGICNKEIDNFYKNKLKIEV